MVGMEAYPNLYTPLTPPQDPPYNTSGGGRGRLSWGENEDNTIWGACLGGRKVGGKEENNNGFGYHTYSPPLIRPHRSLPSSPIAPPHPIHSSSVPVSPSPPPSPPNYYYSPHLNRTPSPSPFSPTHTSSLTHSPTISSTCRDFSPFPSPTSSLSPSPCLSPTPHSPSPSPPPRILPNPELAPLGCIQGKPISRGLLTRCQLPQGVLSTGVPGVSCGAPAYRPPVSRPPVALTCQGPRGAGGISGPSFFTDLCTLWPDLIVRLAHDIALETPSPEDAPDPPDPPSKPTGKPGGTGEGKCCSDEDHSCPQLVGEQTQGLVPNPPPPPAPSLTQGVCPSPICGSPGPRKPKPNTSGPTSMESVGSGEMGDVSTGEFFTGEDEVEEGRESSPGMEDAGEAGEDMPGALSWESRPEERKRRRLPEIPKNKKSFSTATILALRTPTLAEELQEAESGVASRSSTPEASAPLPHNQHPHAAAAAAANPILVLKCHAFVRDDSTSPDSELRLPATDIDSGHSTQHSPDGPKSMSPLATVNGSLSPGSPSSSGVPFSQLGLLEATHRGLYRFIPRHHDEVHIEIGDAIYVQREADDLWCEGVNLRTGRQGIFPAAHVTDVDYSDFDPTVPKVKKERYLLSYLGSIETLCHKGNQVLCQAVRKIAGGEESAQHPHPCILEVTDKGIRMVDKSKPAPNQAPCHDYFYHLKHVSFCAFHPKDHRYFGFITKHPSSQRFACHIFKSTDTTRPVAEAVGYTMAGRLFSPLLLLLFLLVQVRRGEAQILLKGRCPKIDSMENFEPDRFLGAWHEVERYFVSYEHLAGICWVENYLFDPKRGYYTRLDWQDRLSGQILNIENGITFDPKEPGRLSYVVQRPSIPILRGEYLLLSTDYFYYALAWQCQDLPLGLGHTEILWLLSKMSSPTAKTVDRAKKVAYELGLNVDLLQRQDRSKCNNPSPAY